MRFGQAMTCGLAVLALAGVAGCSDDETGPTHHTSPVAARLVVNGTTEINDGETLTLLTGATATIEVRLLDEHGDVISGIEESHYIKLNFTPAELTTSADVADHHFQKTITAQGTSGTGTLSIGYGHDADADEKSFGTINVVVTPCACAGVGSPEVVGVVDQAPVGIRERFEALGHDADLLALALHPSVRHDEGRVAHELFLASHELS